MNGDLTPQMALKDQDGKFRWAPQRYRKPEGKGSSFPFQFSSLDSLIQLIAVGVCVFVYITVSFLHTKIKNTSPKLSLPHFAIPVPEALSLYIPSRC